MEIIPIIRYNYLIFVTPVKFADLDKEKCSKKFLAHAEIVNKPDFVVHVKCNAKGELDYRFRGEKNGEKKWEYRIYDISKHERDFHSLELRDSNKSITQI